MNKDWNPDSVEQKYERNFIDNEEDIISNARQVEGIVSHETQLGMLPGSIVDDAQEELLRIRQEAADEEQITDGSGMTGGETMGKGQEKDTW